MSYEVLIIRFSCYRQQLAVVVLANQYYLQLVVVAKFLR